MFDADVVAWTTVSFAATAGVVVELRSAATAGALAFEGYVPVANGASIAAATGNDGLFVQVRAIFTRVVPKSPGADADVWRGQSSTAYLRRFAKPTLASLTLRYVD